MFKLNWHRDRENLDWWKSSKGQIFVLGGKFWAWPKWGHKREGPFLTLGEAKGFYEGEGHERKVRSGSEGTPSGEAKAS